MGHPCKFQRVSRLGSVTAWHSISGHQPNFAALNSGRHLYPAGLPSHWALAHVLVNYVTVVCEDIPCATLSVKTTTDWSLSIDMSHISLVIELFDEIATGFEHVYIKIRERPIGVKRPMSDVQIFRQKIPILMFNCSVML